MSKVNQIARKNGEYVTRKEFNVLYRKYQRLKKINEEYQDNFGAQTKKRIEIQRRKIAFLVNLIKHSDLPESEKNRMFESFRNIDFSKSKTP